MGKAIIAALIFISAPQLCENCYLLIDRLSLTALPSLDMMYQIYDTDPKRGSKTSRIIALSHKQETIFKTINRKSLKM